MFGLLFIIFFLYNFSTPRLHILGISICLAQGIASFINWAEDGGTGNFHESLYVVMVQSQLYTQPQRQIISSKLISKKHLRIFT